MRAEPTLLHDLLHATAERLPGRPAVSADGQTLRHAELAAASRRAAAQLVRLGVRPGERIVISAPSSVLLAALVYASSQAGAVFSLLHEQVGGPQFEHILDDCEPALVISDRPQQRAAAERRGVRVAGCADFAAHAFDDSGPLPAGPAPEGPPRLAVDPVCLIYTSGTTALPKAVVSTHGQVLFAARAIQQVLGYRAEDIVHSPLPLSFDYGLYQLFLGGLSGALVRLGQPSETGPGLPALLRDSGATVLPAVPSVAGALARLLRRSGTVLPHLRLLTNTGAAMPKETLDALRAACPRLRVQLMYGLTECKRATVMPADGDLVRPGSSGLPLPGTEVFVVDDAGRRLPHGAVGEITVRGPHVMAGYWRRPALTAERYVREEGLFPQLRTGDYGRLDEEGYLYVSGRRDDLYKAGGFRVGAAEVEAAARRVPGVQSAAVLPPHEERPALLFVTGDVEGRQVLEGMREQIEEFKIPPRCLVLAELPLTGNGKVDRKALGALAAEVPDARH
ncbi:class I adenylate-forming enzyme family protein [Streptomyces shenzhenensis]|uniref:class I adenylate-forming enzyme family protein n=1 Tax=Streptomyces shenzhenensis TaxID=943815 RepID=UPI00381638E0